MQQFYRNVQNKKKTFWIFTLGLIFLIGCFMFPFTDSLRKVDQLLLSLIFILMSGFVFNALLPHKPSAVFISCAIFTGLGIALRYALEFGNSSNSLLFTSFNITVSLIALPLLITLSYLIIQKYI
ncbi:MAG: hypothetical protein WBI17_03005 [Clostridiaceae bacterium]